MTNYTKQERLKDELIDFVIKPLENNLLLSFAPPKEISSFYIKEAGKNKEITVNLDRILQNKI